MAWRAAIRRIRAALVAHARAPARSAVKKTQYVAQARNTKMGAGAASQQTLAAQPRATMASALAARKGRVAVRGSRVGQACAVPPTRPAYLSQRATTALPVPTRLVHCSSIFHHLQLRSYQCHQHSSTADGGTESRVGSVSEFHRLSVFHLACLPNCRHTIILAPQGRPL